MKKLIVTTTLLLSMIMVYPVFAVQQGGGSMNGMKKQQSGMMNGCRMSAEKMQQMQASMEKMRATRQQMMAAGNPVERKQLMQQHMAEMQVCMNMMPAGKGMDSCQGKGMRMHKGRMMGGKNCAMMQKNKDMAGHGQMMKSKDGTVMNQGCSCRQMMQEMVTSMKVQMEMMKK